MSVIDFREIRGSRERLVAQDHVRHQGAARRALMWARLAGFSPRAATARRAARRIRDIYEREYHDPLIYRLAWAMQRRAERLKRSGAAAVLLLVLVGCAPDLMQEPDGTVRAGWQFASAEPVVECHPMDGWLATQPQTAGISSDQPSYSIQLWRDGRWLWLWHRGDGVCVLGEMVEA